ncbi:hypothetical protein QOZ89_41675 [Pseudofrankia sp. BMG5.37]|nr:NAD(P)-binding protein [Pseudofrankia sp. BMG5.37]MDT3446043.1 hypothetical protein [Pseudofrankia sp. BMG5.37]
MAGLPVAVIGAGPQGLAAGTQLLERGLEPFVFEAGDGPGAAVAAWGHVQLFSAWPELIDPAAARLLAPTGWIAPAGGVSDRRRVGRFVSGPLAEALGERGQYGTRVVGVSRHGLDRLVTAGRDEAPFVVHAVGRDGVETRHTVRAAIDASGTWRQPNPAGADGLPAQIGPPATGRALMLPLRR